MFACLLACLIACLCVCLFVCMYVCVCKPPLAQAIRGRAASVAVGGSLLPLLTAMAPPLCKCGRYRSPLRGPHMESLWAAHETTKWARVQIYNKADKLAYWNLCQQCHRRTWPEDSRRGNRYDRPGATTPPRPNVVDKLLGKFYLTQSPPDVDHIWSNSVAPIVAVALTRRCKRLRLSVKTPVRKCVYWPDGLFHDARPVSFAEVFTYPAEPVRHDFQYNPVQCDACLRPGRLHYARLPATDLHARGAAAVPHLNMAVFLCPACWMKLCTEGHASCPLVLCDVHLPVAP